MFESPTKHNKSGGFNGHQNYSCSHNTAIQSLCATHQWWDPHLAKPEHPSNPIHSKYHPSLTPSHTLLIHRWTELIQVTLNLITIKEILINSSQLVWSLVQRAIDKDALGASTRGLCLFKVKVPWLISSLFLSYGKVWTFKLHPWLNCYSLVCLMCV